MLDAGIVTTAELGLMGSAFFFTYAFGKFSNGFLSDYANIGRFMSISLIASSFVCIFMGMSTASLFFILLWGINGWFQSVGSALLVCLFSNGFLETARYSLFYLGWLT